MAEQHSDHAKLAQRILDKIRQIIRVIEEEAEVTEVGDFYPPTFGLEDMTPNAIRVTLRPGSDEQAIADAEEKLLGTIPEGPIGEALIDEIVEHVRLAGACFRWGPRKGYGYCGDRTIERGEYHKLLKNFERRLLKLLEETSRVSPSQPADRVPAPKIDFPNPSVPMTKRKAAILWGGDMTSRKLTGLMKSGTVRFATYNRQTFAFCCDDAPRLAATQQKTPHD